MILLYAILSLFWTQPCFIMPAVSVDDSYAMNPSLSTPAPGWSLWATQPVSVTIMYEEQAPITDTISLKRGFVFSDARGTVETHASHPYTLYLCAPENRPGAMYLPRV